MGRISKTRREVAGTECRCGANIEARVLFLKYAFPCAGVTLARGAISKKEYDALENSARTSIPVEWKTLERIFVPAWRRIREVAQKINHDPRDANTIRRYYIEFHNEYIKNNDGSYAHAPEALKKLCRVEKAKIVSVKDDFFVAAIGRTRRPVSRMLCKNARVGDIVSAHYGYAVEKLY
ncbi:MAG: hypothetical protein HY564_03200 [Candidatus Jacksonbacteria bacterium]|nr:hypothetical protein [Candidatus Jacksonbacteria bacterium]